MTLLEKLMDLGLSLLQAKVAKTIYEGKFYRDSEIVDKLQVTWHQVDYSKKIIFKVLKVHSKKELTLFVSKLNLGELID